MLSVFVEVVEGNRKYEPAFREFARFYFKLKTEKVCDE